MKCGICGKEFGNSNGAKGMERMHFRWKHNGGTRPRSLAVIGDLVNGV